jgi:hypothetical protein
VALLGFLLTHKLAIDTFAHTTDYFFIQAKVVDDWVHASPNPPPLTVLSFPYLLGAHFCVSPRGARFFGSTSEVEKNRFLLNPFSKGHQSMGGLAELQEQVAHYSVEHQGESSSRSNEELMAIQMLKRQLDEHTHALDALEHHLEARMNE